jgi:ubiquinone/menaquinone biosynthesis C-methylase UbiE
MPEVYTHGHHESVLRSHTWRDVANSAAYLAPHLRPGMTVLDVGCGPGTLTIDLARHVAPGRVLGIDPVADVLEGARARAEDAGVAVEFALSDVYRLDLPDDTFDVVHAHQVLQHLTDPVAALREMRRVARPGGIVAVRDSDYGAFTWFPASPGLDDWRHLYREVTTANRAECDAGRHLLSWFRKAGFADVAPGASAWCFATADDRAWWSSLWSERVLHSDFARQTRDYGLADEVTLEQLHDAWLEWGGAEDGWFAVLHGEVIARA